MADRATPSLAPPPAGKLSPLPFHWQAAQLCCAAALLAGGTRAVCANSNVLVGYAHLDRALLLLSFIQIPQAINHVPREAWARIAPRPAAQQLCRSYQPAALLLALAAVLYSLYQTERQQRLRLLGEQRRAAQAAASDS